MQSEWQKRGSSLRRKVAREAAALERKAAREAAALARGRGRGRGQSGRGRLGGSTGNASGSASGGGLQVERPPPVTVPLAQAPVIPLAGQPETQTVPLVAESAGSQNLRPKTPSALAAMRARAASVIIVADLNPKVYAPHQ